MRHALVHNGEIIEFRNYAPNVDQSKLAAGKPRLLPVETIREEFNPATQVQSGPTYEIGTKKVIERFSVHPKNDSEIAAMKADKDAAIEAEFLRRYCEPITFEVGGQNYLFHADTEARENIQGTLNMYNEADRLGEPLPDPRLWKPKGEMPVSITRDEIAQLGIAIGQRKDALFTIKVQKQLAIAGLADPAAIDDYDPTEGWAV